MIDQRAAFDFVRYGSVWEDADTLCRGLGKRCRSKRLLSIASAGDNVLAMLTLDPKAIVAVDLNPTQLACLELRIAAFQALDYQALLGFMGVLPDAGRLGTYAGLRKRLGKNARDFWDQQSPAVSEGLIHAGKLERFVRRVRGLMDRWVHGPERVAELLGPKSDLERADYFNKTWDTWAWRVLNRVMFSERVVGSQGRDPQFFKHADKDVTSGPIQRLGLALRAASAPGNPYLRYHLTGNYAAGALPMYLRPRMHALIRRRSGRVTLYLGQAENAPGTYFGFNLSNIFEYMDTDQHARVYKKLVDKAQGGGRLAYWNLHVDRARPISEGARVTRLGVLAQRLHQKDMAWVYRSFHVDQVRAQRNQ